MLQTLNLRPGIALTVISSATIVLTVGLSTYLLLKPFSRHETVPGILSSLPPIIEVKSPEAGVVRSVVRIGQRVHNHEILAYVTPVTEVVDGSDMSREAVAHLSRSVALIQSQLTALEEQAVSDKSDNATHLITLQNLVSSTLRSLNYQDKEIGLLESRLRLGFVLQKNGTISIADLQQRELDLTNAHLQRENMVVALNQDEASIADIENSISRIKTEFDNKSSVLNQSRQDLETQLIRAKSQSAFGVTAQADGIVDTLPINDGERVEVGAVVATVTPSNAKLIGYIYIPSNAIVFVRAGQHVRITYAPFPLEEHQSETATISSVSEWLSKPDEMDNPLSLTTSSYRATVQIDKQNIYSRGQWYRLQSGIPFKADIILEKRTLASWVIQSARMIWRSQ